VEFHDDDWLAGARLVAFEMLKTHAQPDGARCSVALTVQAGKGAAQRKEVAYHVKMEPRVLIARDPYF
jgi:hypothetical protein